MAERDEITEKAAEKVQEAKHSELIEERSTIVTIAVIFYVAFIIAAGIFIYWYVPTPEERPWDYGTVPFVPAESQYSDHDVPDVPLPNPAATRPPPGAPGGAR